MSDFINCKDLSMPSLLPLVNTEFVTPCPSNISFILPTAVTCTPFSTSKSNSVGPVGLREKSCLFTVRRKRPGSPVKGLAITRPTACSPVSISLAIRQILYNSSSGIISSCAATWNTLSADVYTMGKPVAMCSAPSSSIIAVPEAALLPSALRPIFSS
ncbi:MAG: hypothetical protein BWY65_02112 [Firmicutes bacterium ADurb.Bin373]|nr:MAG: hypothetical protein BWY65_02112 [Firmicutes bacterium ADurb.Bin373]